MDLQIAVNEASALRQQVKALKRRFKEERLFHEYPDNVANQQPDLYSGPSSSDWYGQDPTSSDSINSMMVKMERLSAFQNSMTTLMPQLNVEVNSVPGKNKVKSQSNSKSRDAALNPQRTFNLKSIFSPGDPFSKK